MDKSQVDLDCYKLEVFYWVAELHSFSQAAERLFLRQPTVSAHVQELESALRGKLFYRIPGKVSLTPLGDLMLERARTLLSFKRETVALVERFHGKLSGELWIGGSTIPGEYVLPQKLGVFVNRYPEVRPILRIGDSAGIVEAVLDGKNEVGFVGFKGDDPRLQFEKIWRDEMVLAVPKSHPWAARTRVAVEQLRAQRFISREHGSGTLDSFRRLLVGKTTPLDKVLNIVMELGSTEAVKEALIAGMGISILSRVSIRRELDAGLLAAVRLKGFELKRDFYEVVHHRRPLSPVAAAFRAFLRADRV